MEYELIFGIVVFAIGLSSVLFATKLGLRSYNFDVGVGKHLGSGVISAWWNNLVELGINFRVWFSRITGILCISIAIFTFFLWFY